MGGATRFLLLLAAIVLLVTRGVHSRPQGKLALKDCVQGARTCSVDSQFICGIDEKGAYKTFENVCQMEATNCAETKYYSFFMTGPCL